MKGLNVKAIKGIVVPTVTPIDADEKVDIPALKKLLNHLVDGGVHGIFALGTSGEFARLEEEEKQVVLETTVGEVKNRVPVYVGVADCGTKRVISNIRKAEKAGADIIVATLPYYYPVKDKEEQLRFFRAISEATDLPVMLYNIPSTTSANIDIEVIKKASERENIIGIKDSSGDIGYLKQIIDLGLGEEFRILVGEEKIAKEGLMAGAHGLVPSLGNVFPELLVNLYKACMECNEERAAVLQDEVDKINKLNRYSNSWLGPIIFRKKVLSMMGICSENMTEPYVGMDEKVTEEIEEIFDDLKSLS